MPSKTKGSETCLPLEKGRRDRFIENVYREQVDGISRRAAYRKMNTAPQK